MNAIMAKITILFVLSVPWMSIKTIITIDQIRTKALISFLFRPSHKSL